MIRTTVIERNGSKEWRPWYAWFPVAIEWTDSVDGVTLKFRTTVWLENIERRESGALSTSWDYRMDKPKVKI